MVAAVIHGDAFELPFIDAEMAARRKIVGTAKSRMAKETSQRALIAEIAACVELKFANPALSVATAVKK